MERDVCWQRIVIALLIGCAVFAAGKFAYGFRISLPEIIPIVIFMAVVFGLAAVILVFRDRVTLRPNMSAEQREVVIAKRSDRLQWGWGIAIFIMALVALPVHVFGIEDEPLWQRLLYLGLAALIVIGFLVTRHGSRNREGPNQGESGTDHDD